VSEWQGPEGAGDGGRAEGAGDGGRAEGAGDGGADDGFGGALTGELAADEMSGSPDEMSGPPADPDDWTDEQWIEWLRQGDPDDSQVQSPMVRAHRSTGGQILGNAMLGLAEAMYGQKQPEIVLEVDAASDPEDEGMQVHLDPDFPERSTVVVRRRGRRRQSGAGAGEGEGEGEGEVPGA